GTGGWAGPVTWAPPDADRVRFPSRLPLVPPSSPFRRRPRDRSTGVAIRRGLAAPPVRTSPRRWSGGGLSWHAAAGTGPRGLRRGEEVVRGEPGVRSHRQPAPGDVRAVRVGATGPGDHRPGHRPVQG